MCSSYILKPFWIFFFNDTATTEIYTLSLHDALPIFFKDPYHVVPGASQRAEERYRDKDDVQGPGAHVTDRKSTRLNSSHANISYAVFCLKKKKHHSNPLDFAVHIRYALLPEHRHVAL